MYNATNSRLAAKLLALVAAALLTLTQACGNKATNIQDPAQSALNQAKSEIEAGNYDKALDLLNSIDSLYPAAIDVRREVTTLRPQVIEKSCMAQLQILDSEMAEAEAERAQLLEVMEQSQVAGFKDGYWSAKCSHNPNFYATDGIEARANTDGVYYLVSSLASKPLHHTSFTLSTPNASVTSPVVANDGEMNLRNGSSEVVTYFGEQCDSIGQLASQAAADAAAVTVTLHGDKGDKTITLTPKQVEGLATTWRYATNFQRLKQLSLHIDRLNQLLMISRHQQSK